MSEDIYILGIESSCETFIYSALNRAATKLPLPL